MDGSGGLVREGRLTMLDETDGTAALELHPERANPGQRRLISADANRLLPADRPMHAWYRFVLSFPPQLVRQYLHRFAIVPGQHVLDPFCGTGTTIVECKKMGIAAIGLEANPMAHFASKVKATWTPDPEGLEVHAGRVAALAGSRLAAAGIEDQAALFWRPDSEITLRSLPPEAHSLLLTNSISPLPLHKTLVLLECMRELEDERYHEHELLALANALVSTVGNLNFGPEVGVGPLKPDAPVLTTWLSRVQAMVRDLRQIRVQAYIDADCVVHLADARRVAGVLAPCSVDAVVTSPPYPNEKDYTRTTRLESVLLGFIRNKSELRALKHGLVRSNTRGVYKGDDDERWVAHISEVQRLATDIEARRLALGKTSGFERMYPKVAKLYFGGMARHLSELRTCLRPGARLAYVVGDQASYLRVMIRTGQILGTIAQSIGYEVESIDLHRTRLATATREQLREEVVVLRWPGDKINTQMTPRAAGERER